MSTAPRTPEDDFAERFEATMERVSDEVREIAHELMLHLPDMPEHQAATIAHCVAGRLDREGFIITMRRSA